MVTKKKSTRSKKRRRLQSLPCFQNPYQDTNTTQVADSRLLHVSSTRIIDLEDAIDLGRVTSQRSPIVHKLTSNHVEALSSFCNDRNNLSLSIDALCLLRTELVGQDHSQPSNLDLAPEAKGKQALMAVPKSNE